MKGSTCLWEPFSILEDVLLRILEMKIWMGMGSDDKGGGRGGVGDEAEDGDGG